MGTWKVFVDFRFGKDTILSHMSGLSSRGGEETVAEGCFKPLLHLSTHFLYHPTGSLLGERAETIVSGPRLWVVLRSFM